MLPWLERESLMPMKYVMLKLDSGELLPLLFPEFMQHSHMAQSVPATVVSGSRPFGEREDRCPWGVKLSGCRLKRGG